MLLGRIRLRQARRQDMAVNRGYLLEPVRMRGYLAPKGEPDAAVSGYNR